MAHVSRHPEGICRKSKCTYCHPTKNRARVHVEMSFTMEMDDIAKELGIHDIHFMDAKRWISEDLNALIGKLPYSDHMKVRMLVHGMLEDY